MGLHKKPRFWSSAGFWCWKRRCGCRRCLWGRAGAGGVQQGRQELWGASPGRGAPCGRGGAGQLCLGSPGSCGEAFGFLTNACARSHRAKLQVGRGEPGRARCREGARAAPASPWLPGQEGASTAPCAPGSSGQRPKVFLVSLHPSSFCWPQGCRVTPSRVAMPEQEMGAERRVLSSAFPAGPFSRAVCLPSPGSGECSHTQQGVPEVG